MNTFEQLSGYPTVIVLQGLFILAKKFQGREEAGVQDSGKVGE